MATRDAEDSNPAIVAATGLEFQIKNTKISFPVVTLSKENNNKAFRTIKNRI